VILIAWLIGRWIPNRAVTFAGAAVLGVAVAAAALAVALKGYRVPTPAAVVRQALRVTDVLRQTAINDGTAAPIAASVRYLQRCTTAHDRVLVEGFGPDIPVLAHRAFAGGVPDWLPGYYVSDAEVQRTIERLDREQPRVAIMLEGSDAFTGAWPAAAAWLTRAGFQRFHADALQAGADIWVRHPGPRLELQTTVPCPG
jgi:hypothetical protein